MKPVKKRPSEKVFSKYQNAKPDLVADVGGYCSYCEMGNGHPALLDVEHIYPQKSHEKLEKRWRNFLLSCSTCNTYKAKAQGGERQHKILKKHLWPHLDNTFNAFKYTDSGLIEIAPGLPSNLVNLAQQTLDMIGLLKSPARAKDYEEISLAYSGADLRADMWKVATNRKKVYESKNGGLPEASYIALEASKMGYFSVWMEVFRDRPEVRKELIRVFRADPNCFDPITTQPLRKGRI